MMDCLQTRIGRTVLRPLLPHPRRAKDGLPVGEKQTDGPSSSTPSQQPSKMKTRVRVSPQTKMKSGGLTLPLAGIPPLKQKGHSEGGKLLSVIWAPEPRA